MEYQLEHGTKASSFGSVEQPGCGEKSVEHPVERRTETPSELRALRDAKEGRKLTCDLVQALLNHSRSSRCRSPKQMSFGYRESSILLLVRRLRRLGGHGSDFSSGRRLKETKVSSRRVRFRRPSPLPFSELVAGSDVMSSKTSSTINKPPPPLSVPARFGIVQQGVFRSNTPLPTQVSSSLLLLLPSLERELTQLFLSLRRSPS